MNALEQMAGIRPARIAVPTKPEWSASTAFARVMRLAEQQRVGLVAEVNATNLGSYLRLVEAKLEIRVPRDALFGARVRAAELACFGDAI